ncbi:MAG: sodium:solute symporter family protein [Bacillota bacterium]
MSDVSLSVFIVLLVMVLAFGIGMIAYFRRISDSTVDFFVASRTLGFVALFFTYTATYHSASAFLGTGGFFYKHGMAYWALGPFTQIIGGLCLFIFGYRIWLLGKKYDYVTPGDMLGDFYQSDFLRALIGILGALFIIPYIQMQLAGAGWIAEFATFGAISYAWGAIGLGVFVVIYVFFGGIRSVVWTDIFMGIFMFLAIVVGGALISTALWGSPGEIWQMIYRETPGQLVLPGAPGYFKLPMAFSWVVIITIGLSITAPHMIIRMFAAGSLRVLKWVAILAPLYLVWIYVSYIWLGMGARAAMPGIEFADQILPRFTFEYLPVWLAALIAAGGLCATLSTADSQLLTTAQLIGRDVYEKTINKKAKDRTVLGISRAAVICIFIFSAWAVLEPPQLLSMLVAVSTAGLSQFFPSIVGCLFWPRATKAGAISGLIVGTLIAIYFLFINKMNPWGMHPGFVGLIFNIIVFTVVSYLTPPQPPEVIAKFHGFMDSDEARQMIKESLNN